MFFIFTLWILILCTLIIYFGFYICYYFYKLIGCLFGHHQYEFKGVIYGMTFNTESGGISGSSKRHYKCRICKRIKKRDLL